MGLKRYRRKLRRGVKRVWNKNMGKLGDSMSESWKRYKDEIILIGSTALGAALAPVTLGASIPVGAMLGASAAGAATGAYNANKAEDAANDQIGQITAAQGLQRRRARRGGGEGVVEFTHEYDPASSDGSTYGVGAA